MDADRITAAEALAAHREPCRRGPDVRDRLHARGLRWTPQRRVLIEVLSHATDTSPAPSSSSAAGSVDPATTPSTVYRTLDVLEELGIVRHAHGADGREEFHVLPDADHGHLHCLGCRATWEIDAAEAAALVGALCGRAWVRGGPVAPVDLGPVPRLRGPMADARVPVRRPGARGASSRWCPVPARSPSGTTRGRRASSRCRSGSGSSSTGSPSPTRARAVRVLETSHPPVYYVPPRTSGRTCSGRRHPSSHCEWKGAASYWSLSPMARVDPGCGLVLRAPGPGFEAIRGHLAFYAATVDEAWVGRRAWQRRSRAASTAAG